MTLQEFKAEAQYRGHYYDNSANASAAWAKSWGLTYHSLLWAYKEYTLGNMRWKGGRVHLRHGSYQSTACFINDEPVSEYRFKKALETFSAPELTADEQQYIEAEKARQEAELARITAKRKARVLRTRKNRKVQDLSLTIPFDFDAA